MNEDELDSAEFYLITELLLDAGGDVNAPDDRGWTAYDIAFQPKTRCASQDIPALSDRQMANLYVTLGYESAGTLPAERELGTALVLVLVKTNAFVWRGGVMGQTRAVCSTGWDNLNDAHWSTTGCTLWAHNRPNTLAHELGQCFGLRHNGAADRNLVYADTVDLTLDVMADPWAWGLPDTLNLSNRQRVDRHFRALEKDSESATSALSMLPAFH